MAYANIKKYIDRYMFRKMLWFLTVVDERGPDVDVVRGHSSTIRYKHFFIFDSLTFETGFAGQVVGDRSRGVDRCGVGVCF